jgi:hypothetical protein
VLAWFESHSHHHMNRGAWTPYSGSGSSQGKSKGWIGYLWTNGLNKTKRTPKPSKWTPDTRGVSQAHYYIDRVDSMYLLVLAM